jgi:hypothetical protein
MSDEFCLQGVASEFGKYFQHGDDILRLNSRCFDKSLRSGRDIKLLINHDTSQCLGSWTDKLMIYAGEKRLVFRFLLPGSEFNHLANDFDSYVPVSIGYITEKTESTTVNGIKVVTVVEGSLTEISILDKAPAVHSTYGRVVSWETCGGLQEDYEAGRFELVGKYISLHRASKALDNNGVVDYRHSTSPYHRAANNFERALQNLQ